MARFIEAVEGPVGDREQKACANIRIVAAHLRGTFEGSRSPYASDMEEAAKVMQDLIDEVSFLRGYRLGCESLIKKLEDGIDTALVMGPSSEIEKVLRATLG